MPLFSNFPALRLALAYTVHDPTSLLPHATIPNLLHLPIPVSSGLPKNPKIKAIVLDKDNTICPPKTATLHPAYLDKLKALRNSSEFTHKSSILIVSNTAGSTSSSAHEEEALLLERELGIPVLRQQPGRKKPLCGPDVLKFFKDQGVTENPAEIVFVGDRLATDVMIAREIGSWSYWCRDGWRDPDQPEKSYLGVFNVMEGWFARFMERRGKLAPLPAAGTFEKV